MAERTKSFWAWGYADAFPDLASRRGLAAQLAAVFAGGGGGASAALQEPGSLPTINDAVLKAPRLMIPDELAPFCVQDAYARASHTYGKAYKDLVRGARGDFGPAPDFVAYPRDEDEITRVLAWCSKNNVAVAPFGGGTSVVGGVELDVGEAYRGAVSMDLCRLSRVIELDECSGAARIQAGATGPLINAELGHKGYTLRHFPQSYEHATLGGMLATRSGGHFATLHTHIDDFVESIRMITPQGVWQSARVPSSGAGPSPDRWALGSEGVLGVITEAWLRVQKRPRFRAGATVLFQDFWRAVDATRSLAQSGLYPSNCRLLDAREARLTMVSGTGANVLLLGFESADHSLEPWMQRALALAADFGGQCPNGPSFRDNGAAGARDSQAETWRQAFFRAPYLQSAMVLMGVIIDTFETAITWDRFEALHRELISSMKDALRRVCGTGLVTCRFTHVYADGPAPYYTFLGPGRVGSETVQWAELKAAASAILSKHGATITHHHAVGRTHRPWYDAERPPLFAASLQAAKRALDPAWVLNPGVLVDRP